MNPLDVRGALSIPECDALAHLARGVDGPALEVGHLFGLSTAILLDALPPEVTVVTVDHHQGDAWTCSVDPAEFLSNVEPFIGQREFVFVNGDMLDGATLDEVSRFGPYGFVFYDADHTKHAVVDFWNAYRPLLAESCTLVYDDADWDDQSILGELARADGFRSIRARDLYRGPEDKRDPETFTLEVMQRDA